MGASGAGFEKNIITLNNSKVRKFEVTVKRNPLILFFVGALVAVMLFAGIRMSRKTTPMFRSRPIDGRNCS